MLYTPLFTGTPYQISPTSNASSFMNAFNFSLSPGARGQLSTGLQDLFANMTFAFVNERMATVNVEAIVIPDSTEYQDISSRLVVIYGIVFGFSLMITAYGLFCLGRNGTLAVFDLQHVVEMTAASSRLHKCAGHPNFGSTLIRGVVSSESKGTRRRRLMLLEVSD
ncbi:hypothetical protein D9757_013181 [Collybiopsis confluens]|uniref:Uncharacterized protein n=1 Tax=Collybiopsis confluens TaxID=2823264 RepID=A0A8H5D4V8_9AGAR|nr:hypothetical protein D9757_013181 [Collybiopsis confluens]